MAVPNLPMRRAKRTNWNKSRIVGQKHPLQPKNGWAIRVRLDFAGTRRNRVLLNVAPKPSRPEERIRFSQSTSA